MTSEEFHVLREEARALLANTSQNQALMLHAMRVCLMHRIAVSLETMVKLEESAERIGDGG